jgi:hypothetical protein
MDASSLARIESASRDNTRANGFTHSLYRYPASMSPSLARALIECFSKRDDVVLDPFGGGGTTAVEALAAGRAALCSDISPLACFVTRAKAFPLSTASLRVFDAWCTRAARGPAIGHARNAQPLMVNGRAYAPWTHAAVLTLRESALSVSDAAARRLALLTVLLVAKNCFDCRRGRASPAYLRRTFWRVSAAASTAMHDYSQTVRCQLHGRRGGRLLRVVESDALRLVTKIGAPGMRFSFVLTSPPYPGVHVLYHRWQVRGRRETGLPFILLGKSDGHKESYYTMGGRHLPTPERYFNRMGRIFDSLAGLLEPGATVAQVVAFPRVRHHMTTYMNMMEDEGYEAVLVQGPAFARVVPNRRWYAPLTTEGKGPIEYVLVHRLARGRRGSHWQEKGESGNG